MKSKPTKTALKAKLQKIFNAYIRLRDQGLPCISCGKHRMDYHAGHYLAVGSHPELRYNEDNCHKQCVHCNYYKAGNQAMYRIGLLDRIGEDRILALEGPHPARKYTSDELDELFREYTRKLITLKCDDIKAGGLG